MRKQLGVAPANTVDVVYKTYIDNLNGATIGATTPSPSITANTLVTNASVALSGSTQKPWLNQTGFYYGSLSGGGYFNYIANNDEVVGDGNYIWGLKLIEHVITPAFGPRGAIFGDTLVSSAGTSTQASAQYVGVSGRAEIATNLGGTDLSVTGAIGSAWGGWFFVAVDAAATDMLTISGVEVDVTIPPGATVREKKGLLIALAANDAVRGNNDDIALNIASQVTVSNTWKNGILFGDNQAAPSYGGTWPFASDSTMIGTSTPGVAGNPANIGIDFSNVTFSDSAIKTGPAPIVMTEMASGPTSASGVGKIYVASDGSLHYVSPTTDTKVLSRSVATITTATTLAALSGVDYVYLLGSGAAPTMPTAVSNTNLYTLKNTTSGWITVLTTSGQTIDGSTSIQLSKNTSVDLISDGSNWWVI